MGWKMRWATFPGPGGAGGWDVALSEPRSWQALGPSRGCTQSCQTWSHAVPGSGTADGPDRPTDRTGPASAGTLTAGHSPGQLKRGCWPWGTWHCLRHHGAPGAASVVPSQPRGSPEKSARRKGFLLVTATDSPQISTL